MSETVHYKGYLKKLERLKGESLEEQCKRLLGNRDDSYVMTIQNGTVYKVEKEAVVPDDDMFNARLDDNGDIAFEVRYYNGRCDFDSAIEEALKNIAK